MVCIKLPGDYTPRDIARDSLELWIPSCPECEEIHPAFEFPLRRSYMAFFSQQDLINEIEIFDPDLPAGLDLKIKGTMKAGRLLRDLKQFGLSSGKGLPEEDN